MLDKRELLKARLKLGNLTSADYLRQLEIRDEMVNRLNVRVKELEDELEVAREGLEYMVNHMTSGYSSGDFEHEAQELLKKLGE